MSLLGPPASPAGPGDRDDGVRGIGDGGFFPTLSLPGVGDLTSALGISFPGSGPTSTSTSSTAVETSSTSPTSSSTTTSLQTSSSTATSETSTVTLSSTETSTSTSTSTTPTDSTTSQLPLSTSSTTSALDTAVTPPTSPATESVTSVMTVDPTSSAADTRGTAAPSTGSSFLENKPLSIGVITAGVLLGLVILAFVATWALRKRRNDRVDQDIIDFSNANDLHDTEKGYGGTDSDTSTISRQAVPPSVLARQATTASSSYPSYSSPSRGPVAAYGSQTGYVGYSGTGYGRTAYANNGYGSDGYANAGYANAGYGGYQQPNTTYDNWQQNYGGQQGAMANPYEQSAYGGTSDAYGGVVDSAPVGAAMAGVGAGVQRRPSAQRKPAPPLSVASSSGVTGVDDAAPPAYLSGGASQPPPEKSGLVVRND